MQKKKTKNGGCFATPFRESLRRDELPTMPFSSRHVNTSHVSDFMANQATVGLARLVAGMGCPTAFFVDSLGQRLLRFFLGAIRRNNTGGPGGASASEAFGPRKPHHCREMSGCGCHVAPPLNLPQTRIVSPAPTFPSKALR